MFDASEQSRCDVFWNPTAAQCWSTVLWKDRSGRGRGELHGAESLRGCPETPHTHLCKLRRWLREGQEVLSPAWMPPK